MSANDFARGQGPLSFGSHSCPILTAPSLRAPQMVLMVLHMHNGSVSVAKIKVKAFAPFCLRLVGGTRSQLRCHNGIRGTGEREGQICNVKIVEELLLPFQCDALGRGKVKFATSKLWKACFYHFRVMPWGGGRSTLQRQNCGRLAFTIPCDALDPKLPCVHNVHLEFCSRCCCIAYFALPR